MMPDPNGYYVGSELSSDYSTDQPVYYSLTPSYSYYNTGYESHGEWSDQSTLFAIDGQNLRYSGLQTEDLPYLYYSPGYGYMYSSPDQYATYQQYMPGPTYQAQTQLSPSAYVPVVIQPGNDFSSYASLVSFDPSAVSASVTAPGPGLTSSRLANNTNAKGRPHTSTSGTMSPVSLVTGASRSSHHSQIASKPSVGGVTSNASTRENQSGNAKSTEQLSQAFTNNLRISSQSTNNRAGHNQSEDNRGAGTARSNTATEKSYPSLSNARGSAVYIDSKQFNADDFPVDYPNAKFYIIKSYSEDDVHKSIKYGVWSSTPNGNRRLDAAYMDAQRKSTGNPKGCPVFLFFSVNASGQFCGVAEMVGPVDFNKDMEFWQQDKWSGSFPVKWHIVKDVLNASFRHITLENNENKPVTNSRDTQEVPYDVGITMLKIFKNTPLTSSVLEDFPFYETRQQAMLQEKCRRLGRAHDSSLYTPAVVVNTRSTTVHPAVTELASKDVPSEAKDGKLSENLPESKVQSESEEKSDDTLEMGDVVKVGSVRIKVKELASEVIDMGTAGQK
ncbi:hypothetical protein LUZ61_003429 [Rhynchospora tenuis]|uniref:YTH domain-containing family protein n=1 Tax=Rhynchospora tenuis TaxID=198213 RepID=A0AAD5ZKU7_9POAL|nr:hypothetical protein LUZ61_003429 [Rhynchospora tenuis]